MDQELDNRRRFHRVLFDRHAELACPRGHAKVRVVDVSLKGALVELPPDAAPLTEGAQCELVLWLAADVHIAMECTVAWQRGANAGLRCRLIDLESMQHLRRLVELNLGDDELLERDLAALGTPAA